MALREALTLADVLAGTGGTLAARAAGEIAFTGVSIDSRTIAPGALFVAVRGPRFDGHDFLAEAAGRGARAALVERDAEAPAGLPLVRVADTTKGLADLARHVRREAALPVVARDGLGRQDDHEGHDGAPARDAGAGAQDRGQPQQPVRPAPHPAAPRGPSTRRPCSSWACRLRGRSAPSRTLAEPDVATITRIAPVHLEFFPSVDAIAEAKAEILEGLRPGGTAVLNGDDPRVRAIGERFSGRVVWFGRDRRFDVSAENERWTANEPSSGPSGKDIDPRFARVGLRHALLAARRRAAVDVALPLAGPHFVTSFLAAAAAAHVLGVPPEAMAEAATSLRPARHRGEVRRLGERVVLLDDCYNSSPEALEAAVVALSLLPGREARRRARRHAGARADRTGAPPRAGPRPRRARGRGGGGRPPGAARSWRARGKPASPPARSTTSRRPRTRSAALAGLVRPGDAVLVKASRGVRLEAVVDALAARFGEGEA